jgi:hypothetical protein
MGGEPCHAFEATIIADYDATTAAERELVPRLASLPWRIRRATGIETDLFRIQAEILCERQNVWANASGPEQRRQDVTRRVVKFAPRGLCKDPAHGSDADQEALTDGPDVSPGTSVSPSRELTICFLRLANTDNGVFERFDRYDTALWRQAVQTLMAL